MISFNDFRKRQLSSAICQTNSVFEGINYYFDIFRLDLLKAAQISRRITEGQDPEVAEALNWIIDYDNERHQHIVETFINEAKGEFYNKLVEDVGVDLDKLFKNPPSFGGASDTEKLQQKIYWAIDRIVNAHQKDIIARLIGSQPAASGPSQSRPTPGGYPASSSGNTSAPTTPSPPPSQSTPVAPSGGGDWWDKGHSFFKKNSNPGWWPKISNVGKSAIRGIGQGVRGAYRWANDVANGKYLDHHVIERVVSIMESLYEEADSGAGVVFKPLKDDLKKFIGQIVDPVGNTASPVAPPSAPSVPTAKPPVAPGTLPITLTPGGAIPGATAAKSAVNPNVATSGGQPGSTPPSSMPPIPVTTHPPATQPGATQPGATQPGLGTAQSTKPTKTKNPSYDPSTISQVIQDLPDVKVNIDELLATLPTDSHRAVSLNRIKDDQWVRQNRLLDAARVIWPGKLPNKTDASMDTADMLALYNKIRASFNATPKDQYPPEIPLAKVEKLISMKDDQNELYKYLQNKDLINASEYENLQKLLGIDNIGGRSKSYYAAIQNALNDNERRRNLEIRARMGELKSKLSSAGGPTPSETDPQDSPDAPITQHEPQEENPVVEPQQNTNPAPEEPVSQQSEPKMPQVVEPQQNTNPAPEEPVSQQSEPIPQPSPEVKVSKGLGSRMRRDKATASLEHITAINDLRNTMINALEKGKVFPDAAQFIPSEEQVRKALHDDHQKVLNGESPKYRDYYDAVEEVWADNYLKNHPELGSIKSEKDRNAFTDKVVNAVNDAQSPPPQEEAQQVLDSLPDNVKGLVSHEDVQEYINHAKQSGMSLPESQDIAKILAIRSVKSIDQSHRFAR
jgi:hypothetical protein